MTIDNIFDDEINPGSTGKESKEKVDVDPLFELYDKTLRGELEKLVDWIHPFKTDWRPEYKNIQSKVDEFYNNNKYSAEDVSKFITVVSSRRDEYDKTGAGGIFSGMIISVLRDAGIEEEVEIEEVKLDYFCCYGMNITNLKIGTIEGNKAFSFSGGDGGKCRNNSIKTIKGYLAFFDSGSYEGKCSNNLIETIEGEKAFYLSGRSRGECSKNSIGTIKGDWAFSYSGSYEGKCKNNSIGTMEGNYALILSGRDGGTLEKIKIYNKVFFEEAVIEPNLAQLQQWIKQNQNDNR